MRTTPRLLLFSLAALLVSACEVRTWVDIDLSDLGEVAVTIGFDQEFRELLEESGEGPDFFSDIETEAGAKGWELEPFVDGDIEGVIITRTFSSLEELGEALGQAPSVGPGPVEGKLVEGLSITDTGDTIRFSGSIPGVGGEQLQGFDASQLLGVIEFDARVAVTFPGEVLEHNGELQGRTVTWRLFEEDLGGVEMFAEARKGAGIPLAVIAGVALTLLAGGVIGYRLVQDRRSRPGQAPVPSLTGAEQPPSGE